MVKNKDRRLRDRNLFQNVLKKGQSVHGSFLALYWLNDDNGEPSKIGYAVGRRLGTAVARNKMRRRLRHAQYGYNHKLRNGYALVWLVKRSGMQADFRCLQNEMGALLEKANLLQGRMCDENADDCRN